jgi:pimeloyl-ACP methyl ester carboxylesterase
MATFFATDADPVGRRDVIFNRSEPDALLAAVPGAVFKVYPETGHVPIWERPEEVIRDLEDFLLSQLE